jgi:ankyrin repeat protein
MDINYNKVADLYETVIIKIFEYIKTEKWELLEKTIRDNKDLDYNVRDNSNTYILEYVIIFNKISIVKLLLSYENIRIDIIDDNNRSILYNIIKFGYIDILKLFIEKNKKIIGVNIFELKDKSGNIALFYAINFNNLEIIKLIIKEMNTLYIKNNNGENCLHIAIKTQNINTFKLILKHINNLNFKNNDGETCLHMMIKYKCYDIIKYIFSDAINETVSKVDSKVDSIIINEVDSKYNHTPLHKICLTLDIQLFELIKDKVDIINGYIQDKSGNIFFHYFIYNITNLNTTQNTKIILDIYDILKKINFEYNIYNIDNETCCHLVLKNKKYIENISKNYNIILNDFINNTDINIQNNDGYSCFLFIVKNNYWKDLYNILINKKLDIFIYTKDKLTCFNFIAKDDYNYFIEMITKSYINQLRKNPVKIWLDYWDNRCKVNVKLKELNEFERNILVNIKNDEDICYELLYKKIYDYSSLFVNDITKYNRFNSYPLKMANILLIENYPVVSISTYTGSTLDVLSGLLYITKKYSNICQSSLELIDTNKTIVEYKNGVCNFIGFEIVWIDFQLHIPSTKNMTLQNILTKNIINSKYRFFIIPIGIQLYINNQYYAHANYLIIDYKLLTVERFEPYGTDAPNDMNYNAKLLDNNLKNLIDSYKLNLKYVGPHEYLNKIGFQLKEIYESKNDYIGDPNGFCALWSLWWTEIRIKYSNIPIKKLVKMLNKELINKSYKEIIRNYSSYITNYRDKLLLRSDISINELLNEKITSKQAITINNVIIKDIEDITFI